MAPLADAILPYGRLHLTPNRPSLRQSWRQPFSNLIVDVKKLKLLYSEGPQAASGMWETANRSFQHIFNLHFSNPHALIQLASWWPQTFCHPRHDQLTNRADTFILHFTVYKISKNGLQLCFFCFAALFCFTKLFTINLSKPLHWPNGLGNEGLWLFLKAFISRGKKAPNWQK